jgi:hypothetical protein
MENKTLKDLYSKKWNRFAKVFYIFLILWVMVWLIDDLYLSVTYGDHYGYEIVSLFIALCIFEAVRRAFYYVSLGTINPK